MHLPQEAVFSAPSSTEDLANGMWNPLWIQNHSELGQNTGQGGRDGWSMAVSRYYVEAESAKDIAAAVRFASQHDLRLVVKGAGHDYIGRSSAPNSLLVWTRALQDIKWDDRNETVTVQAGVIWEDLYLSAQERGRHIPGGSCPTVGAAGGYVFGGGFGEFGFSRRNGMAAENMIRATVITAAGRIVEASASSHPDLFWALRGGGGGTFGAVFDITFRSAETPEVGGRVSASVSFRDSSNTTSRLAFTERFIAFVNKSLLTPHWGGSWYPSAIGAGWAYPFLPFMFYWDFPVEEARAVFAAFNESLADVDCDFEFIVVPAPSMTVKGKSVVRLYPDFFYQHVIETGRPGQFIYENYTRFSSYQYFAGFFSTFVPMTEFEEPRTLATKILEMTSVNSAFYLSTGKALGGRTSTTGQGTAINSHTFESGSLLIAGYSFQGYWPGRQPTREALTMVLAHMEFQGVLKAFAGSNITYPPECLAVETLDDGGVDRCWHAVDAFVESIAELLKKQVWPHFRAQFPHAGAYANEADYFEPDWQSQFWGDNYERLYQVKQRYDPRGLFVCHHCVGSEDWAEDGNCFRPTNQSCPLTRAARQYWR